MEADKDAYRPGDTVTLKITAKDEKGNPIAARINLAIIDEAMLEISGNYVNVLESLYQWLDSGLGYSYSSHNTGSSSGRIIYGGMDNGLAVQKRPVRFLLPA